MKHIPKRICAAVLAAVGVEYVQAVTLAPDGYGQVLLYPYYTVEAGYDTLISLENSTSHGKAVRVTFLEALNGREALDFNLYLAPYDVWTAKITADSGGGAKVVVSDASCTAPLIASAIGGAGEQAFFTYGFDGANGVLADAEASRGIARTREGYIEVIEMGDIDPNYQLPNGVGFLAAVLPSVDFAVGDYRPFNCAAISTEWQSADWTLDNAFPDRGYGPTQSTSKRGLLPGSGGLGGTGTLINVAQGTDYSYDPVALAGFYLDKPPIHRYGGNTSPSLADAAPISTVMYIDPVTGLPSWKTDDWSNGATGAQPGVDAVSAVLMRVAVINDYVVNSAITAGTDWVLPFPTKRWYTAGLPLDSGDYPRNPVRPYSSVFVAGGACEPVDVALIANQSGRYPCSSGCIDFGGIPPRRDTLCWATNVVTFNNSAVLGSTVKVGNTAGANGVYPGNVNVGNWQAGYASLNFPVPSHDSAYSIPLWQGSFYWANASRPYVYAADLLSHQLVNEAAPNHTFQGLPVIGFAVQKYANGTLPGGVLSNYGGVYVHRYQRNITP